MNPIRVLPLLMLLAACGEEPDDSASTGDTGTPVDPWCACLDADDCAEGQACGVVCSDTLCVPTAPSGIPVCHEPCIVNAGACDCVPYTPTAASGFCNPLSACGG